MARVAKCKNAYLIWSPVLCLLPQLNHALERTSGELARRKAKGGDSALVQQQQQQVDELIRVGNSCTVRGHSGKVKEYQVMLRSSRIFDGNNSFFQLLKETN